MKKLLTIILGIIFCSTIVSASLTLVFNPVTSKLDYVGSVPGTNFSIDGAFTLNITCAPGQVLTVGAGNIVSCTYTNGTSFVNATIANFSFQCNSTDVMTNYSYNGIVFNGKCTSASAGSGTLKSVISINSSWIIITNDTVNVNITINGSQLKLYTDQFYINSSTAASLTSANITALNSYNVTLSARIDNINGTSNANNITLKGLIDANNVTHNAFNSNVVSNITTQNAFNVNTVANFTTFNLFAINVAANWTTQNAFNAQVVTNLSAINNNSMTLAFANLRNFPTGCPDGSYQINETNGSRTCKVIPGSDITNAPWANDTRLSAVNTSNNFRFLGFNLTTELTTFFNTLFNYTATISANNASTTALINDLNNTKADNGFIFCNSSQALTGFNLSNNGLVNATCAAVSSSSSSGNGIINTNVSFNSAAATSTSSTYAIVPNSTGQINITGNGKLRIDIILDVQSGGALSSSAGFFINISYPNGSIETGPISQNDYVGASDRANTPFTYISKNQNVNGLYNYSVWFARLAGSGTVTINNIQLIATELDASGANITIPTLNYTNGNYSYINTSETQCTFYTGGRLCSNSTTISIITN